ncbi:AI-2E family transporter [Variovorax sp. J31P179]|uniref:AI-2E family transporter n=1 Tax=Variovorax sp. J31P179 TaxID=3053508 RepID=UPI002577CF29|nr:AI-2E family transporter [Variovorax sp. J31P179]MDM0079806.1 AI-2E family transporter [Variovorax sp. J31P179]
MSPPTSMASATSRESGAGPEHGAAASAAPDAAAPSTALALVSLVPELRTMAGAVTATVVIAALYFGRDILMPLALAFLLGFVLDPLVMRLKRLGLPRAPAVMLVVLLALGTMGMAGLLLGSQVSTLSAELPTYQNNIKTKLSELRARASGPGMFDGVIKTFDTFKKEVEDAPQAPAPARAGARGATGNTAPAPAQAVQLVEKTPSSFQQGISLLEMASAPLATAGIVLVFVVLILLDRLDLRDRLVRLWGGSLHRSTDAMDEAGQRISKYLTMQLVVNFSYGVPMALGLWFIGVPGAMLWGAVAAVMRFVPYVGPMISAVFPIALAFAVDPGWSMVLWTIGLIIALEMLSNNVIEPWLYGASTGLSAMSLMVAATFWTALWGPLGLIMSTPLTVCLMVIGRHLPRLRFLDVLLGSQPALDAPTRIYQRLIADDVEEAIELATDQVVDHNVLGFYNETGLQVLRMASSDHANVARAEHRHRVVIGIEALIDEMRELHPEPHSASAPAAVVCIGGKWEVDTLAARMLAHALSMQGCVALPHGAGAVNADFITGLDLGGVECVCISYFSPDPQVAARHFCRRLKRRWPGTRVVLGLWNAPPELLGEEAIRNLGADGVVTSVGEAVVAIAALTGTQPAEGFMQAARPEADADRLHALRASGALDPRAKELFDAATQRAADVFDVPMAMVSLIEESTQEVRGAYGELRAPASPDAAPLRGVDLGMPRELSMCGHVVANAQTLVVPDVSRDLRFAGNPALQGKGLRFYAGAPLRGPGGHVLGTLCLLDVEPRALSQSEVRLLEAMAKDLMQALQAAAAQWGEMVPAPVAMGPPSATVGQLLPSA